MLPFLLQAHVLLPSCININACDDSEQGGMGPDPVKPSWLSETLQAEQLSKAAGHTRTSVSLRNRDENWGWFLVITWVSVRWSKSSHCKWNKQSLLILTFLMVILGNFKMLNTRGIVVNHLAGTSWTCPYSFSSSTQNMQENTALSQHCDLCVSPYSTAEWSRCCMMSWWPVGAVAALA